MDIPEGIERAINDAVARHLEEELGERGLVLEPGQVAAAEVEAAQLGSRLLAVVIRRAYPMSWNEEPLVFEFDSEHTGARFRAALAFGALTARVLSRRQLAGTKSHESIELASAVFNVGIGLVDGLCDEDAVTGRQFLELIAESDLVMAAEHRPERHWLGTRLSSPLARDATVGFTVNMIEEFFETLHIAHPGEAGLRLRRTVAQQLTAALAAERVSVAPSPSHTREQLLACSRLTSVLPFEIIETLARPDDRGGLPSPATRLGEAVWQIDDLVDVCEDARRGALNSLLIGAAQGSWNPDDEQIMLSALEHLLDSTDIIEAAERAAENLLLGLEQATRGQATLAFLCFIQDYAGIPPRAAS